VICLLQALSSGSGIAEAVSNAAAAGNSQSVAEAIAQAASGGEYMFIHLLCSTPLPTKPVRLKLPVMLWMLSGKRPVPAPVGHL